MYERNAIVLERYFNQMFGYNIKNNIQTNFKDYTELVECLEKYKDISEEEETIMQEYDSIANKIREIQKKQEILDKKNNKYQEERANIFQNIDESTESIQKKIENANSNIKEIDEEINNNAKQFVEILSEFNEKTSVRIDCERSRRDIENKYNKKLNETLDNYKDIDPRFVRRAKQFADLETDDIEEELKEKIKKNGEKENTPFNIEVIKKAIVLSVDIQKRKSDILVNIYDKTNKLFIEIKNNSNKSSKHKKTIKDSKSKLEFVGAIEEYLIGFLDNERLTAVNGQEEHNKLMEEACKNLDEDIMQINNLYTLLLKEISKKITKKSYAELYNIDYLKNLEAKSQNFEEEIKKLKLPVTIINPNYWRIEGMKKIYDVFYKCVTEGYGRDLSEYIEQDQNQEQQNNNESKKLDIEKKAKAEEIEEAKEEKVKEESKIENKSKSQKKEIDIKEEIDKKIDMILGFDDENNWESDFEDSEDWEDEDFTDEDDSKNEDLPDDDDWDEDYEDDNIDDEEYDDDTEEDEDDWDIDFENEKIFDDEEDDKDDDFDIFRNKIEKNNYKKDKDKVDDNWEDEFVNINNKDKVKKKKSFFSKFKK